MIQLVQNPQPTSKETKSTLVTYQVLKSKKSMSTTYTGRLAVAFPFQTPLMTWQKTTSERLLASSTTTTFGPSMLWRLFLHLRAAGPLPVSNLQDAVAIECQIRHPVIFCSLFSNS